MNEQLRKFWIIIEIKEKNTKQWFFFKGWRFARIKKQ